MSFWTNKKVVVTGGTGFLGHHLLRAFKAAEVTNFTGLSSRDYDLTREDQVIKMFEELEPGIIFHLAGLVGGILVNRDRPADFFYRNLMMGTLVLHHAAKFGVKKFIAAGAGCGYPEFAPMPLKESDLWSGLPQKESAPYSLAKRLLTIQAAAYQKEFGITAIVCIPGNIYGEYDNFNFNDSHVVPALVRKFVEATNENKPTVEVWGTGKPTRDYIYAGDAAAGMLRAAEVYSGAHVVNLSSGQETSVLGLCALLKELTGFKGQLLLNSERPDGQMRRFFDVSKAKQDLNFSAGTSLQTGLRKTIEWYKQNVNSPDLRK